MKQGNTIRSKHHVQVRPQLVQTASLGNTVRLPQPIVPTHVLIATKVSTELEVARIILRCAWHAGQGNSVQIRNARRIAKNATWATFQKLPEPPLNVNPALPVTAKNSSRNQIVHPVYVYISLFIFFFFMSNKINTFLYIVF